MWQFCREHNSSPAPSHYELSSLELHTAVDFHSFVWLIWLHSVKEKEQEGEGEKGKSLTIKLGYNNPQDVSKTKKRRKVLHQADSLGKDTAPAPAHRTRWASTAQHSTLREESL